MKSSIFRTDWRFQLSFIGISVKRSAGRCRLESWLLSQRSSRVVPGTFEKSWSSFPNAAFGAEQDSIFTGELERLAQILEDRTAEAQRSQRGI
jgi:hypothetical protein